MIKFTMAARCEAAGRPNNEDNFQLVDNLAGDQWGFITDNEVELGEKGALMVVCDGMGGLGGGATASDIAIKTIKEWFVADNLTPEVTATPETIRQYIEEAIIAADENIKEAGRQNTELAGMGSTIVLAWIFGENVHVGWCGDSRAYRYNPAYGLEQLSHDHSYVQELVDNGKLLEALAFDHPDSNIITRSLGDTRQEAKPDTQSYPLCNGDIILLCSDGLSDVLRDMEIETVLSDNADTMEKCRQALWTESEQTGWTDNVTVALCRISSGAVTVAPPLPESLPEPEESAVTEMKKRKSSGWIVAVVLLLLGIVLAAGYYFFVYLNQN
jgi:serine/threonine protein phosphatase PrpC